MRARSYLWLVAMALVACHHDQEAPIDQGGSLDDTVHDFATVAAAPPRWTDEIPARIVFDETRTSRLGAPLAGRVANVMVQLGQHVKQGAPLFSVTSGDLAGLRNDEAKARVDLEASRTNYARVKNLVDQKALPQKELTSAQQDLAEAELALTTAMQKLSSLKVVGAGETQFTVAAPRAGVIVEKTVSPGQQVSPDNGALIAIADLADVWIVADLLEDAIDDIKPGTKAEITLDSGGAGSEPAGSGSADGPLAGTVDQVSAIVDPDRHTVPVRVKLDNASGALRPNALAQIRFLEDDGGQLAVPGDALLSDGANSYVYVIRNGHPVRQDVVAGPRNAKLVTIRSGLAAGDKIVARGAVLLDNQLPTETAGGSK
jgi:RND family efflux transporter MFP subunit